ncbi:CoA transferase subunit A [Agathobaculum desmolans]|uniref:CoA transferase subunit A n=1 Tax=Agathobaculum desmolans TaxID=39484 RepID=UPI0004E0CA4C|nr:3-oxoacid CoA-transferase subunit A [Agathobaculum desmolans]
MKKRLSVKQAVELIPDGAVIMCGGFLGCGTAHRLIDALVASHKKNLTIICNDAGLLEGPNGEAYYGIAKLIHNRQVSHLIATHIGLNPEATEQMNAGSMRIDLLPQGSLAEMIRAGGAGLGGILTKTGIGTLVEDAKDYVVGRQTIDGVDYLLMRPLRADIALICGQQVDDEGNVWYEGTARNFNQVMATAANIVIVEAEQIVSAGEIRPENVQTFGILVDYIVNGRQVNE